MLYPNLFKSRYSELNGRKWLLSCTKEDIQAFARLGFEMGQYGRLGGIARAHNATRDQRGRFISKVVKSCEV